MTESHVGSSERARLGLTIIAVVVGLGILGAVGLGVGSWLGWALQILLSFAAGPIIEYKQSRERGFNIHYALGLSVMILLCMLAGLCLVTLLLRYLNRDAYAFILGTVFPHVSRAELLSTFAACLLWCVFTFVLLGVLALRLHQRAGYLHRDLTQIADVLGGTDLFARASAVDGQPPKKLRQEYERLFNGIVQKVWTCLKRKVTPLPSHRRLTIWLFQPILKPGLRTISKQGTVPALANQPADRPRAVWEWIDHFSLLQCWSESLGFAEQRGKLELSAYDPEVRGILEGLANVASHDSSKRRRKKLKRLIKDTASANAARQQVKGMTSVVGYVFHTDRERWKRRHDNDILSDGKLRERRPDLPPFRSYIGLPLHHRGHRIGVLFVTACQPWVLTDYHRMVLATARHVLAAWVALGSRHRLILGHTEHTPVLGTFGRGSGASDREEIP